MDDSSFQRFSALCAMAAAVCAVAYGLLLLAGTPDPAGGLVGRAQAAFQARGLNTLAHYVMALMAVLMSAGMVGAHRRVWETARGWALWSLAIGIVGAAMMAAHAYWEALRVPVLLEQWETGIEARQAAIATFSYVPNPVDPRGLGAFLFVGLFVLVTSWLVLRGDAMSSLVGRWGLVYGAMLVALFAVGALEVEAVRMILAALTVGVAGPIWWLLLGRDLLP